MVAMRLADLLAGLSRLADLGFGLHAGEALRSWRPRHRAWSLDMPSGDPRAAYYTAPLHHVGCTGYAHETARIFGDELVMSVAPGRRTSRTRETCSRRFSRRSRGDATARAGSVGRDATLRLPEEVQQGVSHVYELWQGAGVPAGDDIPVASRIARLTGIAVLFATIGGADLAVHAARRGAAAACWIRGWQSLSRVVPRCCSAASTPRIRGLRCSMSNPTGRVRSGSAAGRGRSRLRRPCRPEDPLHARPFERRRRTRPQRRRAAPAPHRPLSRTSRSRGCSMTSAVLPSRARCGRSRVA